MKLYYHPLSGHAHRARLFLSLLGPEAELVEVDLAARAHKAPDFLKLNPFGQLPVLDDDGTIVPDSNAILVYIAKKNGAKNWLPEDPAGAAAVQRWLSVAAGEIAYGPCAARLVTVFGASFNADEVIARAHVILQRIEAALDGRQWIAADHPTIADVALTAISTVRRKAMSIDAPMPISVRGWKRIEALPGFVAFQKTPIGIPEAA